MFVSSFLTPVFALALARLAGGQLLKRDSPQPFGFFDNNVIYQPEDGKSALYPRFVELEDGTLLVTSSLSGYSAPFFPVFESKDGGASWSWISNITDQVNGWGLSAQPALAELTEPLGGYPAGTILATGNSWSENGTRFDIYASTDGAKTWEFVSLAAEGGRPNTTNGADPVWEPYLLIYNNSLVCYYSDQRDPLHGQKLAHQRSFDLRHWEPVVNDVAYAEYARRPGMTVVTYVQPIDSWVLVYEFPGAPNITGAEYPVYYRIARSPLEFDAAPHHLLDTRRFGSAAAASASPYVTWSPEPAPNGTIIISDADHSAVFTNTALGDEGSWQVNNVSQPSSYSRAMHVFQKQPDRLMILGASVFNQQPGVKYPLSLSVVSLNKTLQNSWPLTE
ncbi:hypothetical protein CGCSCA4_v002511 [Colletotrichum siamense]|uniref:Glycoside hydrolase family 93 protein n=1 Tax=Colletotrichum siamense TaxID=690259 RepID=A0A9P5K924_COLSI|nr:hypothetical protein CGCSCA4_v002511 [Colletotrichum siamense]KAF4863895.1 hypothetical protein CGCSCA2_v002646 [Colletotrichum siamense]